MAYIKRRGINSVKRRINEGYIRKFTIALAITVC